MGGESHLRHKPFIAKMAALFFFATLTGCFIPQALAKENHSLISKEAFLSSDFPRLFKARQFQKALDAVDALRKKYPNDPLILRYRALTLDKLGRHQEAIAAYREILSRDPNHVPTHLFLGLAYARAGKSAEAAKELHWVSDHSASKEYRHWAEAQLARIRQKKVSTKVAKKPYLLGKPVFLTTAILCLSPMTKTCRPAQRKRAPIFRSI